MTHLDEGLLRRWLDEASRGLALSEAEQAHLAQCTDCQTRLDDMRATAHFAAQHLSDPVPPVDATLALARLRQREQDTRLKTKAWTLPLIDLQSLIFTLERMLTVTEQTLVRRWIKPVSAVALVALLIAAFMLTPLGSYAQGVLDLFTPKQFVAVPMTAAQARTLPDLDDYGDMRVIQEPRDSRTATEAEAAQAVGFSLLKPSYLPQGIAPDKASYAVTGGGQAEFTFNAQKAAATAAKKGQTLPTMPANMDGAKLNLSIPNAVVTTYGNTELFENGSTGGDRPGLTPRGPSRAVDGSTFIIVAQMKAPSVTSTGVTVDELKNYLLSQPGLDPQLAASLRAIADPTSTLPIPIPANQYNSKPVQVQGVQGLFLGDSSGLGSGVVWQKNGIIYAVGGALREGEVLQIANSLR